MHPISGTSNRTPTGAKRTASTAATREEAAAAPPQRAGTQATSWWRSSTMAAATPGSVVSSLLAATRASAWAADVRTRREVWRAHAARGESRTAKTSAMAAPSLGSESITTASTRNASTSAVLAASSVAVPHAPVAGGEQESRGADTAAHSSGAPVLNGPTERDAQSRSACSAPRRATPASLSAAESASAAALAAAAAAASFPRRLVTAEALLLAPCPCGRAVSSSSSRGMTSASPQAMVTRLRTTLSQGLGTRLLAPSSSATIARLDTRCRASSLSRRMDAMRGCISGLSFAGRGVPEANRPAAAAAVTAMLSALSWVRR